MTAFAWNIPNSADYAISTNLADDCLSAINTHFVANSGGANAKWEVAGYSGTSPRYCILKRKNGAAGRIGFFGQQGSTANAASYYVSTAASALHVCYSATGTANTPDNNWTSGAFFSASDFMPGMRCHPASNATWRFSYAEFDDGVYILISNTSNGFSLYGAGSLIQTVAGVNVPTVITAGTAGNTTGWSKTAGSGSVFDATVTTDGSFGGSSGNAGMMIRTSSANRQAFRCMLTSVDNVITKLNDTSNTISYFLPIPLVYSTTDGTLNVLGKLRQVAFGPLADRETRRTDGSANAYGHNYTNSGSPSNSTPPVWFVDKEV